MTAKKFKKQLPQSVFTKPESRSLKTGVSQRGGQGMKHVDPVKDTGTQTRHPNAPKKQFERPNKKGIAAQSQTSYAESSLAPTKQNQAIANPMQSIAPQDNMQISKSPFENEFMSVEGQKERLEAGGRAVKGTINTILGGKAPGKVSNTGISFVDNIINYAVNNPKTTALIGMTALKGASLTIQKINGVGTKILAGETMVGNVNTAASGQILTDFATGKKYVSTAPYVQKVMVNTATAKQTGTFIAGLVKTAKNPTFVAGFLGTIAFTSGFWAPDTWKDTMTSYAILQNQATKDGDIQSVMEIDELMKETAEINPNIPFLGFKDAIAASIKASMKASEINTKKVERIMTEKEQEQSDRQESENYYQGIKDKNKADKLAERAEQKDYTDKERAESEAYYTDIRNKNRERELREREEDRQQELKDREEKSAYYDSIKKTRKDWDDLTPEEKEAYGQYEDYKKSKLNFGII